MCVLAVSAISARANGQAATIDATARREVIDTVAAQIERIYVDADTGRMIAARLRDRLRAGGYDTIADPTRLSQALTTDLRSVNHDLHLSVAYSAGGGRGAGGGGGPLGFLSQSQHFALGRVEVLPGNIGYMEINGFSNEQMARDVIVGALKYLQTTDAMIIDLRRNRGGDGNLVNFLISHFTGPDTLASVTVKVRFGNRVTTRYTLASVPGSRRPDVPLYVLTSRATGSAGEDCAFVLKNLKRATIIGDRTAGAGHNVTFVPSGHGFQTGISFSRVSDPRTGKEWEQIGVQPDVKVDVSTALDVGQSMALKAMSSKADDAQRRLLDLILESVDARVHPHEVPGALLATYAGEYEGNRKVSVAGGRLMYEAPIGGVAEVLVALSDSVFVASSQARLLFARDDQRKWVLRVRGADGATLVYARLRNQE
jgi:retinol-binding protein 3